MIRNRAGGERESVSDWKRIEGPACSDLQKKETRFIVRNQSSTIVCLVFYSYEVVWNRKDNFKTENSSNSLNILKEQVQKNRSIFF
ncbi:hypothetical protein TNIN_111371 [Trichonephila inaurata madagascariensis]|uniref:Uncharacterized protein n=1 Tax=Trichonephila inaurata madagascariensis TaxID=2747483 RepID=A0A8X6X0C5_9ARAC|nr:hypothetical protein TNIN_111371 [Trichonephila inaurata madagascariensis]